MAPQYADFTKEEFETRYAKTRALMAERNIDAMLITERLNYQYYSGHRSEQCAVDKIRSYVVILPRDGEPTLITMPFEVAQVEQTSFITDIRTTGGLKGHPDFICGVLRDLGLSRARIGCEFGREQYLGISYLGLQEVMNGLAGAKFVDAADIILTVRNVKSPQEIEFCRRAATINAEAQKKTFQEVGSGMTENEIAHVLRRNLIAGGAERLSLLCVLSGANERGIVLLPTDRVVQQGETLGFDVGVSFRGYWSDLARTASVGEPSEELAEFYNWMMRLRHDCNMQLTVGNRPADVIRVVDGYLEERGLKTMGVGRVGHGVGVETTEYPSLATFEDVTFEVGNVFACNPNFSNHLGFINAEDNWAVTTGEPDLLSAPAADWEIPVVEA
ncbi:MAG: aminopeptidase P family protein [Boseongicola sp. SB0664_bin_43]|uniref:Aminopeptidase P family protein n=1 Tax=Boseongicola sp. SB0664_bin_43 TaxID=2604844 RepID=A0A6B0Y3K6_9RHOB|nr:aminopeptidase P family protein [Boseongicola sp. SB0664_bin_43]MYK31375.1 aminopeptidase P family protein [Boseongicola sp. SB0670_bin_30]